MIWASILLLLLSFYLFYHYKFREKRDVFPFLIWLIPLSYLLSLTQAASTYSATNMVFFYVMFATLFLIGFYLTQDQRGNRILQQIVLISGYGIVLFGLLYWLGNTSAANFMASLFTDLNGEPVYKHAIMSDSNGLRLTSVFQYANTYSAFLLVLLFGSLFFIQRSRTWYGKALHASMLVPILLSFFLTLSRGGLVVLPVVLLLLLFFYSLKRQITTLIHLVLGSAATLAILSKLTSYGAELQKQADSALSAKGWGLLLAASLTTAALVTVTERYIAPWLQNKLEPRIRSRFASAILPVAAILVGTIGVFLLFGDTFLSKLLPDNVRTRIENINFQQHSVLERVTFYKDSFKLFEDYPVLGAGGGAWAALYEKYQNNPYTSRQAHNYFLQNLNEVGLIGFLLLFGFLILLLIGYIRQYIRGDEEERDSRFFYFLLVVTLLIHSTIDFNLSYAYLSILLFLSLGGLASAITPELKWKAAAAPKTQSLLKWGYPGVLSILGLVFLIFSIRLLSGNTLYNVAVAEAQQGKPYQSVLETADQAIAKQAHPDYLLLKHNVLNQVYQQLKDETLRNEANAVMAELKEREPYNKDVFYAELNDFLQTRNLSGASSVLTKGIENYPWSIELYEKQIQVLFELGNTARMEKNAQAATAYWKQAEELYQTVVTKQQELLDLPEGQLQGRDFQVTNAMTLAMGQISFLKGDYASASSTLASKLNDNLDDPTNLQIARWYLASIQKQGKSDQAWLSKLTAKSSTEPAEVQKIVALGS
ncbi:hypothetical protein J31TS4_32440 [Paenibacillus sp. J31TS4]|nr:hypothetical protein J31TS4_32440 [Paenibacillus sp. J31TS4]